ncbi:hypothetical protein HY250_03480 [Candidatus Azambacteria bacterium]|nr:hypothetical protein [Candidatus Azambacteria bacterium]
MFNWNAKKIHSLAYSTLPLVGLLVIVGRNSHILFSETRYEGYAREIFQDYWNGGEKEDQFEKKAQVLRKEIQQWYDEIIRFDPENMLETDIKNIITEGRNFFGALLVHTIYVETFDEKITLSVIGNQKKKAIDSIWEKATHPYFESFETRRLRHAISLIEKNIKNKEKLFWYTGTDYFSPKPLAEIQEALLDIEKNLVEKKADLNKQENKQRKNTRNTKNGYYPSQMRKEKSRNSRKKLWRFEIGVKILLLSCRQPGLLRDKSCFVV